MSLLELNIKSRAKTTLANEPSLMRPTAVETFSFHLDSDSDSELLLHCI